MPELPDVTIYREALEARILGQQLTDVQVVSPFVLRSVEPPLSAVVGATVKDVRRLGKRLVIGFAPRSTAAAPLSGAADELFLVLHLMIAGRLRWRTPAQKLGIGAKLVLARFDFSNGTLFFTEASSKKRASMQVVRGAAALEALNPGGLEPLDATPEAFAAALARENHTLKRALRDPRMFSGIGNAYSDEILHAARLPPLKLTASLSAAEVSRLYDATQATLRLWIDRLRLELNGAFPEKVTAFHEQMAVHGRFKQPCPVCGAPIQRIVYAEHECNYCATCQTGGRLLADRSLSRLLRDDWPKHIDDI